MILGVYTVRDEASAAHMALQLHAFDEQAIRAFDFAMQSNDIMKFKPEDFSLWYLGTYNDQTAVIEPQPPKLLKRGVKRGRSSKS